MADNNKIVVCAERHHEILKQKYSNPRLVYRGPASMGDIWGLIREDVSIIIIIDCSHSGGASAWHREIIDAFHANISIIGAGGIGALRAMELDGNGMLGVGWVYEQYFSGILESDDEVLESSDGLALVDVRFALESIGDENKISPQKQELVLEKFAQLHYLKRTHQNLVEILNTHHVNGFEKHFPLPDIRLKDSFAAIEIALQPQEKHNTTIIDQEIVNRAWQWFKTSNMHLQFVLPEGLVKGYEICEVLDDHVGKKHFHTLSEDFFTLQWLKEHALRCTPEYVKKFIHKYSHLFLDEAFLLANGLTSGELNLLLSTASTIQWAKEKKEHFLSPYSQSKINNYAHGWAIDHCVKFPTDLEPGKWVIDSGPEYFGFDWDYSAALMKKLQLDGSIAYYAKLINETPGVATENPARGKHV